MIAGKYKSTKEVVKNKSSNTFFRMIFCLPTIYNRQYYYARVGNQIRALKGLPPDINYYSR